MKEPDPPRSRPSGPNPPFPPPMACLKFSGDVMTLAEAAAFCGTTEQELLNMADAGEIPARRVAFQWQLFKVGNLYLAQRL